MWWCPSWAPQLPERRSSPLRLRRPSVLKSSTPTPVRCFAACPSAPPNPLPRSGLQPTTTSSTFSTPQSCTVQERLKKTPCPCCPTCAPSMAQPSSLEGRACTSRRRFKASTPCRQTPPCAPNSTTKSNAKASRPWWLGWKSSTPSTWRGWTPPTLSAWSVPWKCALFPAVPSRASTRAWSSIALGMWFQSASTLTAPNSASASPAVPVS